MYKDLLSGKIIVEETDEELYSKTSSSVTSDFVRDYAVVISADEYRGDRKSTRLNSSHA